MKSNDLILLILLPKLMIPLKGEPIKRIHRREERTRIVESGRLTERVTTIEEEVELEDSFDAPRGSSTSIIRKITEIVLPALGLVEILRVLAEILGVL